MHGIGIRRAQCADLALARAKHAVRTWRWNAASQQPQQLDRDRLAQGIQSAGGGRRGPAAHVRTTLLAGLLALPALLLLLLLLCPQPAAGESWPAAGL
jgi:hypothetical protein